MKNATATETASMKNIIFNMTRDAWIEAGNGQEVYRDDETKTIKEMQAYRTLRKLCVELGINTNFRR